jgi:membrane fusion protein, heavy metal efflux system
MSHRPTVLHCSFSIAAVPAILFGCVFLTGCGRTAATPEAENPSVPKAPPGNCIVVPPNSPKRQFIRVAAVSTSMFQLAEVVAPGEVQANPNRVSRVLSPVAGRIQQVLAHLGDTVTEGQPVAVVESPDASAGPPGQFLPAQSAAGPAACTGVE